MTATSEIFYLSAMTIFILEGWVLSVILPFHSHANDREALAHRLVPLDGLRGILALSVFFTHTASFWFFEKTGVWATPPSNFFAQMATAPVSMFFFITGYLFWTKLRLKPKFPRWEFWLGRLGRLTPAYVAVCICAFLFAACLSGFHRRVPTMMLLSQAASWLAFRGVMDLNSVAASQLWLGPAWTLRLEWKFYASLPFLGWFARRRSTTLLLLFLAAVGGVALQKVGQITGHSPAFVVSFLLYYAYTFSVGIIVAILPPGRLALWARTKTMTLVSLGILCATLLFVPAGYGPLESACLAVPFASICLGNTWFGLLSTRALRFLGRISYSFYLMHYLGLAIALYILKGRGMVDAISPAGYCAFVSAVGMVIICVCAFSYQYLEYPFLNVGRRMRSKKIVQ